MATRSIHQRKSYKKKVMRVCDAFDAWSNTPSTLQSEISALEKLSLAAYRAMKYLQQRTDNG